MAFLAAYGISGPHHVEKTPSKDKWLGNGEDLPATPTTSGEGRKRDNMFMIWDSPSFGYHPLACSYFVIYVTHRSKKNFFNKWEFGSLPHTCVLGGETPSFQGWDETTGHIDDNSMISSRSLCFLSRRLDRNLIDQNIRFAERIVK